MPPDGRFCPICGRDSRPESEFSTIPSTGKTRPIVPREPPLDRPYEPDDLSADATERSYGSPGIRPPRSRLALALGAGLVFVLLLVAWVVLSRMPFGRAAEREGQARQETIGEAPPPTRTPDLGVIVEATDPAPTPPLTTVYEAGQGKRTAPDAAARPAGAAISESEAMAVLAAGVRRYYPELASNCIEIRSGGYENVGYTLELFNACQRRLLDRWRVDAVTRDLFRQYPDGRFLRP